MQNLAIKAFDLMVRAGESMRDELRTLAFQPDGIKKVDITIGPGVAAELLGRSPEGLAKAEAQGRLPQPQMRNGRRFYSVYDLENIRALLGIKSGKAAHERAVVIGVQNFKGGVGKSTITKHLADYLGLRGMKVLVLDMDPQASTTVMFDIRPEALPDDVEQLSDYLSPASDVESIKPCIMRTAWPTIDIIPSNLGLQDAEWDLTATIRSGSDALIYSINRLRIGLEEVIHDYDVILLDPPPALGLLGLNVMNAANAMLIPCPARQLDYLSTIHFMKTTRENLGLLARAGFPVDYDFVRVLCSSYSPNRPGEAGMLKVMQNTFGTHMISEPVLASEEIKNAGQVFQSIYETNRPSGSQSTFNRCRDNLNSVFNDVERLIRSQWASHSAADAVGEAA